MWNFPIGWEDLWPSEIISLVYTLYLFEIIVEKKIYFHLSPWVSWKLILGQLFYSHFLNKMMKHKIMQKQTKPRLHCPGLLTNGWVSKLWAAFLAGLTWAQHTLSSKLISSSSLTFAMKSDRILSFKPHIGMKQMSFRNNWT